MALSAHPSPASQTDLPARAVLGSIAVFWLGWILLMTARAALLGFDEPLDLLPRRLGAALAGAVLTLVFWRGLQHVRTTSPSPLVARALVGAVPLTVAFTSINWALFYGWNPPPSLAADVARWGFARVFRYAVIDTSVSWYFFFAGWGILYLFLRQAHRSADAERAATAAQLSALRYQVNPHFLFNGLNALSDLVQSGQTEQADRMILDLSALLRRMLEADSTPDARLIDEIELQRLYLALEARRFEGRLRFEIDLPEALEDVPVPRFILQPLVENAVKYAVGRTRDTVLIRIVAASSNSRLVLSVLDDGVSRTPDQSGLGIGLANVRERLRLHYGTTSVFSAGPIEPKGYEARIEFPCG